MRKLQSIQDDLLARLGACGFADVVDLAVVAVENHSDSLLAIELAPNALPTQMSPCRV